MPTSRRRVSATVAAAAAMVAGIVAGAAVAAAPCSAASASTGSVVTVPLDVDRGVVVEIPRNAPRIVDLTRAFPAATTFSVSVFENGSTGYLWSASLDPESGGAVTLLDTDYVSDVAPPGMVGVGGTRYFRYRAVHPGLATITLKYQRSWEPAPIGQVTLRVVVC